MTEPTSNNGAITPERKFSKPDPAARRLRMREFQTRLVDRMQAARGGIDVRAGQLGVLIGATRYLFDLTQAGEIITVGAITRVPLTQPWFLGLANIRGNLISVVDFSRFVDGPATVLDKQCRIIAFAPSLAFNGGLLVSRVLGLRNIADMQPHGAASASERDSGDRWNKAAHYIDKEQDVWQMLDLIAVTRNPQFLQVGA